MTPSFRSLAFGAVAAMVAFTPLAMAQEGTPVLRVYIDSPYFYDFMAAPIGENQVRIFLEGKEVGEAEVTYDCAAGTYEASPTADWTGGAEKFLPAAIIAYTNLNC